MMPLRVVQLSCGAGGWGEVAVAGKCQEQGGSGRPLDEAWSAGDSFRGPYRPKRFGQVWVR